MALRELQCRHQARDTRTYDHNAMFV